MLPKFIRSVILAILKVALFVSVVALGIVMVPDWLVERVERGAESARDYLSGEAARRAPEVKQEVARQAQETKSEVITAYQAAKEKYFPALKDRVIDFIVFWR